MTVYPVFLILQPRALEKFQNIYKISVPALVWQFNLLFYKQSFQRLFDFLLAYRLYFRSVNKDGGLIEILFVVDDKIYTNRGW